MKVVEAGSDSRIGKGSDEVVTCAYLEGGSANCEYRGRVNGDGGVGARGGWGEESDTDAFVREIVSLAGRSNSLSESVGGGEIERRDNGVGPKNARR